MSAFLFSFVGRTKEPWLGRFAIGDDQMLQILLAVCWRRISFVVCRYQFFAYQRVLFLLGRRIFGGAAIEVVKLRSGGPAVAGRRQGYSFTPLLFHSGCKVRMLFVSWISLTKSSNGSLFSSRDRYSISGSSNISSFVIVCVVGVRRRKTEWSESFVPHFFSWRVDQID